MSVVAVDFSDDLVLATRGDTEAKEAVAGGPVSGFRKDKSPLSSSSSSPMGGGGGL